MSNPWLYTAKIAVSSCICTENQSTWLIRYEIQFIYLNTQFNLSNTTAPLSRLWNFIWCFTGLSILRHVITVSFCSSPSFFFRSLLSLSKECFPRLSASALVSLWLRTSFVFPRIREEEKKKIKIITGHWSRRELKMNPG